MKCLTCPFKVYWGMSPVKECRFFFSDVPEDFVSKFGDGCNLKLKEAKKLASIENVAIYNGYFEELRKKREGKK